MIVLMILAQVADEVATTSLSTGGMVVMTLSILSVLSLLGFCLFKVLTLPPVDH